MGRRLWSGAIGLGLVVAPIACITGLHHATETVVIDAGSTQLACGRALSVAINGVEEGATRNPFQQPGDLTHLKRLCRDEAKSHAWLGGGIAVKSAVLLSVLLAAHRRLEQGPSWERSIRRTA